MSSTVVGLQGVQVQLVPDGGGEVGGLPWHDAGDEIVSLCFHVGKENSPDIEDRVISLFKLGNNKHVLVFEDYVLSTNTSLE